MFRLGKTSNNVYQAKIFIEPKIGKKKVKNKNEHGSIKFADLNEIKNAIDAFNEHKKQNNIDADIKISFAKAKPPQLLPYSLLLITFQKSAHYHFLGKSEQ